MRRNPNVIDIDPSRHVYELAEQHGVDMGVDGSNIFKVTAGGRAKRGLSVTKTDSQYIDRPRREARYVFTEYNYTEKGKLLANRMLAAIRPGDRTELAYWTAAAKEKSLTVHRGVGTLVIGSRSRSKVELIPLDADLSSEVVLPARSFYSIEANKNADGLLIVSGLYVPPVSDWEAVEVEVGPGQEYLTTQAEGMIRVPDAFRERYDR